MEIFDMIYSVAVDAFFKVGVFVSISLLIIGLIDYKFNGLLLKLIEKNQKNQIYFAALLGLIPGCGGAIVIVPLYISGKVSFGSLVTAFITTMGDAAFVLMVGNVKAYFAVLLISGFVGILTGMIIDKLKIGTIVKLSISKEELNSEIGEFVSESKTEKNYKHVGHNKGDIIDKVLHKKNTYKYIHVLTHKVWYKLFWVIVILSIPLAFSHIFEEHSHSDKESYEALFEFIGFLGTFLCIVYTGVSRKIIKGSDFDKTESKLNSAKETLIHTAEEVAFLVTWVFIAFLLYQILIYAIGGEDQLRSLLNENGFWVVIAAIFIGILPGCGPQILLAAIYVSGGIPFSALVANAICNDGDALFPLIALSKKSAFLVTIYNLIPALIVGGALYFIENM
ncbi:arsenic efflux protein [Cetobacterium sp. 8H]|uniref:putative manganese transporter n=1 Tax=Cetobacterium sp. 8H TaxID=2759681 RepID=UPI00163CC1EE|nr:putative manganese transporter [Cetobacterium sp. 8H]MBC2851405.1 arsenic efflux protein [Cetobacterium sp. 8H]